MPHTEKIIRMALPEQHMSCIARCDSLFSGLLSLSDLQYDLLIPTSLILLLGSLPNFDETQKQLWRLCLHADVFHLLSHVVGSGIAHSQILAKDPFPLLVCIQAPLPSG